MTGVREQDLYFDFNATTPVAAEVREAMMPYLGERFGNPSSDSRLGRAAREAVEAARAEVAALIGARPDEIVFTGGGTEASNLAIRGAGLADGAAVVTSAIEHPATEACCALLERAGRSVRRVAPRADGVLDPDDLARAIDGATGLVTLIHAQNEIGTLQPVAAAAALARAAGALVHADAAQSLGKVPVDVTALGVDLLSIAGHKLYAPKGVGALFVRRGVSLRPVIVGAGQERGLRPGTENVPCIVGLGVACRLARETLAETGPRLARLTAWLLARLRAEVPGLVLVGEGAERLPNTLNLLFPGRVGAGADRRDRAGRRLDRLGLPRRQRGAVVGAAGARHRPGGGARRGAAVARPRHDRRRGRGGCGRPRRRLAPARRRDNHSTRSLRMTVTAIADPVVRLTELAHGGGCGCKLAPSVLQALLAEQPQAGPFAQLLVGTETGDDAAVWQVDENTCVIATTDFFMPMVDDPRDFGRIAATNAISDVYAMGGRPIMALAVLGMPLGKLPVETVRAILAGGAEICAEAGIPVAGGHSIDAPEPIYGLAVIGLCRPEEVRRNRGARPGDALILTKGIGVGIYSAAIKRQALDAAGYAEFVASTTRLNRVGTRLGQLDHVHAVTDVTGFGLLGHALEMARGSGATLAIEAAEVPLLAQAEALARAGFVTGASGRNWASYGVEASLPAEMPDWQRQILTDPQTSGGLLVACHPAEADGLVAAIRAEGYPMARRIGGVEAGAPSVRISACPK